MILERGEVSVLFKLVFRHSVPLLQPPFHICETAAFSIQLRRKLCVQEESGLPSRRSAHITRTPAPAAHSATCSRMLHLKVQFLDDSQKIFVVDVSGYHILIFFFILVIIIEVIAALKCCMVSDSFCFFSFKKKPSQTENQSKQYFKSETRGYSTDC